MIYLLEFFRVQLSVSVLLGLVFVPKVCVPLQKEPGAIYLLKFF